MEFIEKVRIALNAFLNGAGKTTGSALGTFRKFEYGGLSVATQNPSTSSKWAKLVQADKIQLSDIAWLFYNVRSRREWVAFIDMKQRIICCLPGHSETAAYLASKLKAGSKWSVKYGRPLGLGSNGKIQYYLMNNNKFDNNVK